MIARYALALRPRPHPYDRPGEPITHFSVIGDGETVGTVEFRTHLARDEAPWSWAITIPIKTRAERVAATDGREETRAEALRKFRRSYEMIRNAIGEEGWAGFVEHNRQLRAREERAAALKASRS